MTPSRCTLNVALALLINLLIACSGADEIEGWRTVDGTPKQRIKLTAADREVLLQRAQAWGVPQPKPTSSLIKISAYGSASDEFYALGFVDPAHPKSALVGSSTWELRDGMESERVADLTTLSLRNITSASPFAKAQKTNHGLITGIQLLRRGEVHFGTALIEKSLAVDAGHTSPFRIPAGEEPVRTLARTCLAHAINQITTERPDFRAIRRDIAKLVRDEPGIKSKATDWALVALSKTIAYKPAAPGTVERLIDDYLMSRRTSGIMGFDLGGKPEAERALILRGFAAIPSIMKQRESERLSNHLMQGFNNFSSYPMEAGQVLSAYLRRFSNDELGSNWLHEQKGLTPKSEAVGRWWKKASRMGEEEYVRRYLFVPKLEGSGSGVSEELLLIAQERYPEHLPDIYRRMLKAKEESWSVAGAIAKSKAISKRTKIALFEAGIATNSEAHRNTALKFLRAIDSRRADGHLVTVLKNAPRTPVGEYWLDQDATLGDLVGKSSDPEVWAALHSLLKRADLGMRMELIAQLNPPRDARPEVLKSYHEIYLRYREEGSIRNESSSEKFSGPGAGFPYERIAMRDFIHLDWAQWLELELEAPEEKASRGTWRRYRSEVAEAIARGRGERKRG